MGDERRTSTPKSEADAPGASADRPATPREADRSSPARTAPGGRPPPGVPFRQEPKKPAKPRRVRGGLKLKAKEGEHIGNWIGQRLMRVLEDGVPGEIYREGLEYARLGQVRRIEFEGAVVVAAVQGRRQRAYSTRLALTPFEPEQRDRVIAAMADQSRYAAKLLAGELPPNIEDLFAPLSMRLFPGGANDFSVECDCAEPKSPSPWCKHAVCAAALLAERMSDDPFLIFAMRGLPGEILIDSLRQKRAIAGLGSGPAPVHVTHVPGASDAQAPALADVIDDFWAEPDLSLNSNEETSISMPIAPPEVTHALLRRLGPSPFTESRFRFVGLMATCYDLVSERVIREAEEADAAADDEHAPQDADAAER